MSVEFSEEDFQLYHNEIGEKRYLPRSSLNPEIGVNSKFLVILAVDVDFAKVRGNLHGLSMTLRDGANVSKGQTNRKSRVYRERIDLEGEWEKEECSIIGMISRDGESRCFESPSKWIGGRAEWASEQFIPEIRMKHYENFVFGLALWTFPLELDMSLSEMIPNGRLCLMIKLAREYATKM